MPTYMCTLTYALCIPRAIAVHASFLHTHRQIDKHTSMPTCICTHTYEYYTHTYPHRHSHTQAYEFQNICHVPQEQRQYTPCSHIHTRTQTYIHTDIHTHIHYIDMQTDVDMYANFLNMYFLVTCSRSNGSTRLLLGSRSY